MRRVAFVVVNSLLERIWGTSVDRYESPAAMPQSCMLLQSLGVSQMKFAGFAEFNEFRNSVSDDDVVLRRFAHLAGEFMSAKVRKAKWSAPLGGLKLQVPEPEASSANACQLSPADSSRSTMFGAWMPKQQ
jgi:hypothetical protein